MNKVTPACSGTQPSRSGGIISSTYQGLEVHFTEDAWFNATEAAARFGRRIDVWLKSQETRDYIAALCEISNTTEKWYLRTRRGNQGGTWLHPRLAVVFARWIDPRFGVWCDAQIYDLLRGSHPHHDWKRLRHEAASSFKVMNQILMFSRAADGKESAPHHFSNEARLVNWALTGEFGRVDRDGLDANSLDLLAKLEERNAVLIGRGVEYPARKVLLEQHALDYRLAPQAVAGRIAA